MLEDRGLDLLIPLREGYSGFVAATIALAKLGCADSEKDSASYGNSADARLRILNLRCNGELHGVRVKVGPRLAHCEGAQKLIEELRQQLSSPSPEVREGYLKLLLEHPLGKAFPLVAPLLADPHRPNRELAAECLKVSTTTNEDCLAALSPYFTYQSQVRGEQAEADDLTVRRRAIETMYFEHKSKLVQDRLLAAFDRPGLGIKKQLTEAFRYCPEPDELKQAMLRPIQAGEAENALSAWFVLGIFADPNLRSRFHEAALSEDAEKVYAGVLGLYKILSDEDVPVLQKVRERWKPE